MDKIEVTQADYDAAQAFFRDDRTGLAVKFQLGAEPQPLLEAFARHRLDTRTDATPVAWMYSCGQIRMTYPKRANGSINGIPLSEWTEVPLYTHPPATDVAALVEALRTIQRETTAVTSELENLELCVGTIHSYVTKVLAPFMKGQNDA